MASYDVKISTALSNAEGCIFSSVLRAALESASIQLGDQSRTTRL